MSLREKIFCACSALIISSPALSTEFGGKYVPPEITNIIYGFSLGKEVRVKLDQKEYKNFYTGSGFVNKDHYENAKNWKIDDWFKFKGIEGEAFNMGSPGNEAGRYDDENQIFDVNISDFWMQTTQLSQFQYWVVTKKNPSYFKEKKHCPDEYVVLSGVKMCPNHPVERVSWDDAKIFLQSLNNMSEKYTYKLPTEAQWEYAARAGTTTSYSFGDDENDLVAHAWYSKNSDNQTHQVASLLSNGVGLSDMHGNVWEWVEDHWSENSDRFDVSDDPVFINSSPVRVVRGGSWSYAPRYLRSAVRFGWWSDDRYGNLGVRLVRTPN